MRTPHWLRFLARPALALLAGAGRVRCPGFSRSSAPAYGSAAEARLAACRRMSTACLLRRVARGTWSRTSHTAAVTVLDRRYTGAEQRDATEILLPYQRRWMADDTQRLLLKLPNGGRIRAPEEA